MASSTVSGHQISTFVTPVNGTVNNADQVRGNDNTIKTSYDAHDADATIHVQDSLNASRPAASVVGRKWLDNDTYRLYYDDGSAWHELAYLPTAGGTVSGNMVVTGTLGVTSDFAINTNKFTVAAASGNTVIAGTLTSGLINGQTITSAANFTGTVAAAGKVTAAAALQITSGQFRFGFNDGTSGSLVSLDGSATLGTTMTLSFFSGVGDLKIVDHSAGPIITIVEATKVVTFGGAVTASAGISFPTNSSVGFGFVAKTAADGLNVVGITGSTNDFILSTGSGGGGAIVLRNPTGTTNLVGSGTFTATRHISSADVSLAIAKAVASDGTTIPVTANHSDETALTKSFVTSFNSVSASGTILGTLLSLVQSVATSGTVFGARIYSFATHTSGTVVSLLGVDGAVVVSGSGGTVTGVKPVNASATVESGATVTNLQMMHVGSILNAGTITNAYGLYIESVTAGATLNYAIKTLGGRVGFVSLPTSSAGLASGDLWNNSGVVNIV